MSFLALALGHRGDVEPLAVLTAELARRGVDARVALTEDMVVVAEAVGAPALVLPLRHEDLEAPSRTPWRRRGGLVSRSGLRRAGQALAGPLLDAVGPGDTVLGGLLTRALLQALEEGRGCRPATVLLSANLPTARRDSRIGVGPLDDLTAAGWAGSRMDWHVQALSGAPLAAAARRELGLPAARWTGEHTRPGAHPNIVAVSPLIVPPAEDWPAGTVQTGYLAGPPKDVTPSAELTAFLDDGAPPVHVGFGSLMATLPQRVHETILEAARLSGVRVVMPAVAGRRAGRVRRDVFASWPVAHSWLFPQTAGVVHHGGAGTMWSALRAGVPSVAVPATADQPYHAERLHTLGVGPVPVPMQELTAEVLAALLLDLSSGAFDHRATEIGNIAAAEDGVADTITALERLGLV